MLFVVWCLLVVAFCCVVVGVLFDVWCLLFVACCLLRVVWC